MTEIRTFEVNGHEIRLYFRGQSSAELALWASDYPGMTLIEIAKKLVIDRDMTLSTATAYMWLSDLFPFEIDGHCYGLDAYRRIEYLPNQHLDYWQS